MCISGVGRQGKDHALGAPTVFTKEQEDQIAGHIQDMEKALYGLTKFDVCKLAYDFAESLSINHPFNKVKQVAGNTWYYAFMKRHPELALRVPQPTSFARAAGFTREKVQRFYTLYNEQISQNNVTADRVWNMDETGVSTVHKPGKIVATHGIRHVAKVTSGEKDKTVTVACCMNAIGNYIPPLIIFPRKILNPNLMRGAPTGAIGGATESGWVDGEHFMKWLRHFVQHAKPSIERKHILIVDGHHAHKTLEVITYARENGIIIITLPPHTTHRMQPLDKAFFKAFKTTYPRECDRWMLENLGCKITYYDVSSIVNAAYVKTASVQKGVSGFRACGLWPFNDNLFTNDDFASESDEHTTEGLPATFENVHNVVNVDGVSLPEVVYEMELTDVVVEEISVVDNNVTNDKVPNECSALPTCSASEQNQPDNLEGAAVEVHVDTPLSTSDVKSLFHVPKKGTFKQKNQRRGEKAEVITSSPYQKFKLGQQKVPTSRRKRKSKDADAMLTGKVSNPPKKRKVQSKTKVKPAVESDKTKGGHRKQRISKSKFSVPWSQSTQELNNKIAIAQESGAQSGVKQQCLVCLGLHSADGRIWRQCQGCRPWAHEACTPLNVIPYVCHVCAI